MGQVSTCQKNCNTIDLRRAQVNKKTQTTCIIREMYMITKKRIVNIHKKCFLHSYKYLQG